MNVLIIHTYYYPIMVGGAEYSVKKIAEGLASRGYNVFVLCDTDGDNVDEVINNVKIFRRKMITLRQNNNFITKVIRAFTELFNLLNCWIILDIFNKLNNTTTICYTNSLRRISRVPWIIAKLKKIPIIDTQREYRMLRLIPTQSFLNKFWAFGNKIASSLVDYEAFVSKASMDIHTSKGFFPKAQKHIIYNSIDFDLNTVRQNIEKKVQSASTHYKFKFVYLGSLEKHKGIDILLSAYNLLYSSNANIELHIAGKGSMEKLVNEEIHKNNTIIFHGWLSEGQVGSLLSQVDCLICPSIWAEPFGRVVLDAYKYGIPAIVSRSGGLAETVIDKQTGLLVEPNSITDLHEAMNLISTDLDLYIKLSRGISSHIVNYSIDRQLDKLDELFKESQGKYGSNAK